MIISHKLKVIFIKTKKVAGTSFEIALSKYCGDRDILTPISADDEQVRKDMGYMCAQNYDYIESDTPYIDEDRKLCFIQYAGSTLEKFYAHMDALSIKNMIPLDIWDNYLKISISRDPCEVVLSRYFYDHAHNQYLLQQLPQSNISSNDGQPVIVPMSNSIGQPPKGVISFKDFVYNCTDEILSDNFNITHIKGINVIDYIIKYENLQQDISLLEKKINTPGLYQTFARMNAKGNVRPQHATVNTMFTEELKAYVQKKARLTAG